MQLIATARFQQALKQALASKPYTAKITELAEQLSGSVESLEHPLLRSGVAAKRSALLVITSNRGLCGGYNGQIIRAALAHLDEREARAEVVDLHVIGRKGINYFRFLKRELATASTDIEDRPRFADAERMADRFIQQHAAEQVDAVHVACMRFFSAGSQRPTVLQLLPLVGAAESVEAEPQPDEIGRARSAPVEYDFSPPPDLLLPDLLPHAVKARLYQCLIDASVSEHVARMVAMKAATEAAEDMIKHLTCQYNRSRQTQITLELLDIVGGSEALK